MVAAVFDPRFLSFSEPIQRPQGDALVPYLPVRCPDSGSVCWKPVDGVQPIPLRRPHGGQPAGELPWSWEEDVEPGEETGGEGGELIYLFDSGDGDELGERGCDAYESAYAVFEPVVPYDYRD